MLVQIKELKGLMEMIQKGAEEQEEEVKKEMRMELLQSISVVATLMFSFSVILFVWKPELTQAGVIESLQIVVGIRA